MRPLIFVFLWAGIIFAQYPSLLWTADLQSQCYGSPACADIDGDGFDEIVFGTYFDDEHAYALNGEDGSVLWRFDVGGGPLDAAPVVFDVNGDGEDEVIIPASWGIVYCLSPAGEVVWRYPNSDYIECIDSPPAVADVDGDGLPEVIFGAWYGRVYVLNGEDGSLVWSNTYCDTGYVQSAPCIVDCDGDGALDIVVAMFRGDHKVYALRGSDGAVLWTFTADGYMYAGASCGDVDLDGRPEVIIGDYAGKVYALNAEDGSLLWQTSSLGYYIFAPTTIADIVPSSPGPEILCAPAQYYFGSDVVCLSSAGDSLWSFHTDGEVDRGAIVAEIDGDPHLEVIFGAGHYLYVLNGEDGSEVWSYPLPDSFPIGNAPIAADFDADGDVDIFCIGGRGYSDTIPNYGRAFAVQAGPGGGATWTMYRHDRYRTGNLTGGPAKVAEGKVSVPQNIAIAAAPNPFNSQCRIKIYSPAVPERVVIADISGRTVAAFRTGEIVWEPKNLPAGVYILSAVVGGKSCTRKLMYLK